jgi:transposase
MNRYQLARAKKAQEHTDTTNQLAETRMELKELQQEHQTVILELTRAKRERDVANGAVKDQTVLTNQYRDLDRRKSSDPSHRTPIRTAHSAAMEARNEAASARVEADRHRLAAEQSTTDLLQVRAELADTRTELADATRRESHLAAELQHTQRALAKATQANGCQQRRRKSSVSSTQQAKQQRRRQARHASAASGAEDLAASESALAQQAIDNITDEMHERAFDANERMSFTLPAIVLVAMFTFIKSGMTRPAAMRSAAETHHISLSTMYVYYNYYSDTGEMFNPYACVIGRKSCPLLEQTDVVEDFHREMRQWRAEKQYVTADMATKCINEVLLADLVKERDAPFSRSTVLRWLALLGYTYKARRKTIYIDKHERDDVVQDRARFIDEMERLHERMRVYALDGTSLFTLENDKMGIESRRCIAQYVTECRNWGTQWYHWLAGDRRQPTPTAPLYLMRNQFVHVIDPSTLRQAASVGEFLRINFFERDERSVPIGCVSATFDADSKQVVVLINQDETIVRCKNYWAYNWVNESQGVTFNREKSDGAGVMLSLMIEYGGRGRLLSLSPIELAQCRAKQCCTALAGVTTAQQRVAEIEAALDAARGVDDDDDGDAQAEADRAAQSRLDDEKRAQVDRNLVNRHVPRDSKRKRVPKQRADDIDDDNKAGDRARTAARGARARVVTDVERLSGELHDAKSKLVAQRADAKVARQRASTAYERACLGATTPTPTPQYVKAGEIEIDVEHMCSHLTLQYGKDNGYFDCDLVCKQFEHAMAVARAKYGDIDIRFLIDHSSNHFAMAADGLNAYAMNKTDDTSTQPEMRDTSYERNGTVYVQSIGKRGLVSVLQERGIDIRAKKLKQLRDIMAQQPDFLEEMSRIEKLAQKHNMRIVRGVKFHPELMPIEQVNGAMKCVVRKKLTGSIVGLAEMCYAALATLDHQLVMRFSRKSYRTLLCYKTGDWTQLPATRRRTGQGKELIPDAVAVAIACAAPHVDDANDNKDDDDDEIDAELGLENDEDEDE